jgi:hypothetical protein
MPKNIIVLIIYNAISKSVTNEMHGKFLLVPASN